MNQYKKRVPCQSSCLTHFILEMNYFYLINNHYLENYRALQNVVRNLWKSLSPLEKYYHAFFGSKSRVGSYCYKTWMTIRSSLGLYLHGGGKLGDHQVSSSMLHCNKIIVKSLLLFLSVFHYIYSKVGWVWSSGWT